MIPVVVTCSPRDHTMHSRCLRSIRAAGFDRGILSCEPDTLLLGLTNGWKIETNQRRLGQWRHFIHALTLGLRYFPRDSLLLLAEDDVVFCRNVAQALSRWCWPSPRCGCVQVYSAAAYGENYRATPRTKLMIEHALDMLGACALLFRRDAAEALIDWAVTKGWRGDVYTTIDDFQLKQAADTYVGEVLTFRGFEIWIHNPSLAEHIGIDSTVGHGDNGSPRRRALNFPGEAFDSLALCT